MDDNLKPVNGSKLTRLAAMVAVDERTLSGELKVKYILMDKPADGHSQTAIRIDEMTGTSLNSVSRQYPAALWYEREITDLYGIRFQGNPDNRTLVLHENFPEGLHPLRKDADLVVGPGHLGRHIEPYKYIEGEGEGIFVIPVGPVHAGIIEPGHFRFTAVGEQVLNLELRLFYKHRGLEKLAEGRSFKDGLKLAERIAGDETVSCAIGYCAALEEIAGIEIPERAQFLRQYLQEIERLHSHLNDLTGMATDVAFGVGVMLTAKLREDILQLASGLTGSRFMRGAVELGGVSRDLADAAINDCSRKIAGIKTGLLEFAALMFNNVSVVDRLEGTGTLEKQHVLNLGLVGPVARASGVPADVRRDHFDRNYTSPRLKSIMSEIEIPTEETGDCYARTKLRLDEMLISIKLIENLSSFLPGGKAQTTFPDKLGALKTGIGITEAPRGESIHFVMSGESGTEIFRYHPRTPSRANWQALPLAFEGDIVADFPLVNKSFNLSYAGNDV